MSVPATPPEGLTRRAADFRAAELGVLFRLVDSITITTNPSHLQNENGQRISSFDRLER
jgi:hypothetical protein